MGFFILYAVEKCLWDHISREGWRDNRGSVPNMPRLAIFFRRTVELIRPSLRSDLQKPHSDYKWNAVIQACWSDGRIFSTSMAGSSLGPTDMCKFTGKDSQKYLKSKEIVETEIQQDSQTLDQSYKMMLPRKKSIGENISTRDKSTFLLNALKNLNDSREVVYGALDGWVAWEKTFPLVSLKRILITLEKEEQWHRVVQVIKWMLSKGQGRTRGTYEQLIRALEKDHRAEEAHRIWAKKIGSDLHSVPWRVCDLMISIYYRNNMSQRLIKLFKDLESFDRKPPSKSIILKVADAYKVLGLSEEKIKVLEKYSSLFSEKHASENTRKSRRATSKLKEEERTSQPGGAT